MVCVLVVSVLAFTPPLFAQRIAEQPAPIDGSELLSQAEDLVYAERGTPTQIDRLIDRAITAFESERNGALRDYWLSRAHLLRATQLNATGSSRPAERALASGFDRIRASLDAAGEYSEGLRVLSDLHSQMMISRGLFYMIRNGEEARDAALRALERDPTNIRAHVTVAGFYLNAPPMAGGDVAAGRDVLLDALARDPENTNQRFFILGWLALAYGELGESDVARRYYEQARAIYSASSWLTEIASEI
jgi:tetratricopeptide (TPR) repeat protein